MKAYSGFAGVYDLLMDDFDYPAWAKYYAQLLREAGVNGRNLCECACGTGSLSVELAKMGFAITGVDISSEMLEQAAEKARQNGVRMQLVRQDMCALQLSKPMDAILCTCDGVNYLTSDKRASAFFQNAHRYLKPGGAFTFDISSPHKLRNLLGNAFFGLEREEAAYLWQNTLADDIVEMDITFFLQREDGLYERVHEKHRQRVYEIEQLKRLLAYAGFVNIRVFGDCSLDAPKPDEMRIHFLAMRE